MAIGTYTELQTAIATNWIARSDLATRAPEFIALAEPVFRSGFLPPPKGPIFVRPQETRSTASTVAGDEFLAVPSGFVEPRMIFVEGDPRQRVDYVSPQQLIDTYAGSTTGKPKVFTIQGSEFWFGPTPDAVYEMELIYMAVVPALSDASPTNWLLTNHPNIYLYGSLIQAEPYVGRANAAAAERMATWAGLYETGVLAMDAADRRKTIPAGPLIMRSTGMVV